MSDSPTIDPAEVTAPATLTDEQRQQYQAEKLKFDLLAAQVEFEASIHLEPNAYMWQRLAMHAQDIVAIVDPGFAAKMRGDRR